MPDIIDLGALPVHGGFFIAPSTAPPRTPFSAADPAATDYRHSHTYTAGASTTRNDVVDLIDGATEKIGIVSYLVGDEALRDALERAVSRLRDGVYVITALHADLVGDAAEARERERFEALTALGVAIRAHSGCHAKFAVADGRSALVHSANFMTRAFDTTGENGVLVSDPVEVERAERFFTRLWRGAEWEMDATGRRIVARRRPEAQAFGFDTAPQQRGLIWTFHDEHLIQSAIVDLIATAERELVLATFNVSEMSRRPDLLHDHLRDAVARGVSVKLLLRARSGPEAGEEAAALQEIGVELYPCTLNHAKGVIADRTRGALFSANFDARFGLDSGVELGVRLDGTPALEEALRFFEHSMAEHDRVFVRDPDARALAHGWKTTPWPLPEVIDVVAAQEDWKPLRDLSTGPVVFEQAEDGLRLFADHRSWLLRPERAGHLLDEGAPQETEAMSRLWNGEGRDPADSGLCTAVFRRAER